MWAAQQNVYSKIKRLKIRIKSLSICYQADLFVYSSLYMQIPMFTSLYFHTVYYPKAGNSFTKYIYTHYYVRFERQQKPLLSEKN
jgi:hypothetical protein